MKDFALSRQVAIQTVTIPYCGLNYSQESDQAGAFAACIASSGAQSSGSKLAKVLHAISELKSKKEEIDCSD